MAIAPNPSSAVASAPPVGVVQGEGREPGLVVFEESLVGFFVEAADLLGVPKSVAIIYGIVFASPQPVSFTEIEARLYLSKGSVSQGLRLLREMGAIKEVSTPADKAERFTPDMEMRRLIQRFLEQRLQKQLNDGKTRLTAIQRALPALEEAETKTLRVRLKQLQNWHDKARSILPVVRTLLELSPG
jgi:DNA-binding transcriptional regulator GbsR (MarR family)